MHERLQRIRELQDAAAAQAKAERERPREMIDCNLKQGRLRQLREWLMTGAEIKQHRAIEREDEKDRAEARAGDWTR